MQRQLFKKFARYAGLNILGMIGLSLYILADTYFISAKMGKNGLAALNLLIPVYSLINACGLMLGTGGATKYNVFCSQNSDKKDSLFTHTILTGFCLGCLFSAIGILFCSPIAKALGADDEIFGMAVEYLRTIAAMSPFFICNGILNAYVRNDGSPNLAMTAMLIGSGANIVLDYIFMYPLGMGMFGAALATGCAPILGILTLCIHFFQKNNTFRFRLGGPFFKNVGISLKLGIPSFITEISSGIVLLIFNFIILKLSGNVGVAAYGVVANISIVCIAIFTGLAQGTQPLVSEQYAQQNERSVKYLHRLALSSAALLGCAFFLVSLLFAPQLAAIFNSEHDATLADFAIRGMKLYAIGYLTAGINIVSSLYFTARERAMPAFTIALSRGLFAIVAFSLLFAALWQMTGVWLAFPAAETFTLLLTVLLTWRAHKTQKNKNTLLQK